METFAIADRKGKHEVHVPNCVGLNRMGNLRYGVNYSEIEAKNASEAIIKDMGEVENKGSYIICPCVH